MKGLTEFLSNSLFPRFDVPGCCGVVTTGHGHYFPGVQLLYSTIVMTHRDIPVLLWEIPGLELTDEQRAWCERQSRLRVQKLPEQEMVVPASWWQAWQKPALIANSPFERTIWLDADTLVLKSLAPVFRHVETHPLFVLPNTIMGANHPRLLQEFGVEKANEAFSLDTSIVAYDGRRMEHLRVLSEWLDVTRTVATHPDHLEKYVYNADEGTLRVALQKLDLTNIVWPDRHWSWAVWHGCAERQGLLYSDLANLRQRWPEHHVVHMTGKPKIWESAQTDLLDLEPHEIA